MSGDLVGRFARITAIPLVGRHGNRDVDVFLAVREVRAMTELRVEGGLEALILNHKGDRSFDDLSRACGGSPTGKRLHQMVSRPMKNFPDPDTIKNLARGLNVSPTEIVLATARSLGIRVGPTDDTALVLHEAGTLPLDRQQLLISVSRAFLEGNEAMAQQQQQQEESDAPEDPTQDMLGLAAHKGDPHIGPDELPYE